MRSEHEKMLAGELYDPHDAELVRHRERARDLCQELNATREGQQDERRRLLRELLAAGGDEHHRQVAANTFAIGKSHTIAPTAPDKAPICRMRALAVVFSQAAA